VIKRRHFVCVTVEIETFTNLQISILGTIQRLQFNISHECCILLAITVMRSCIDHKLVKRVKLLFVCFPDLFALVYLLLLLDYHKRHQTHPILFIHPIPLLHLQSLSQSLTRLLAYSLSLSRPQQPETILVNLATLIVKPAS
jgi:hypothetical protein